MVIFGPEVRMLQNELKRPIVEFLKAQISAQILRDVGVVKIILEEFRGSFYQLFVEKPVESGSFGQLLYGAEHILKTKVTTKKNQWTLSAAKIGEFPDATIKDLLKEMKRSWEDINPAERALVESPEYAFKNLEKWIQKSNVKYPESFSRQINESPFDEAVIEGDLKLPLDLYLIDPRFEELFHNYIQAPGMTSPWTYLYGPKSSTLFHMEDALLASVNFNCGPGIKYWWCVPRKEIFKVLALFGAKRPEGCAHEYINKRLSPTVAELIAAGIEVQFFEHKPGELMFLDCGVLHQVINIQWGISISKNLVTESWLEWAPLGLWLRKECVNSDRRNSGSKIFINVTQRFERLMNRLKSRCVRKCTVMDKNAVDILGLRWTPISQFFREQFGVITRGQYLKWKIPQPGIIKGAFHLYSDFKGLTSFCPNQKEDPDKSPKVWKFSLTNKPIKRLHKRN